MDRGTKLANFVLGASGVFYVMVLVYLVSRYHQAHASELPSFIGVLLYCSVPALLASLCFASLWLGPSRKTHAAVLLSSTGASIYGLETMMTAWFSLPSVRASIEDQGRVKRARELGIDFDTRTHLEVVDDFRKKGIEAYPTSHPGALFDRQPDGSLKSKLTLGTEVLPLGWISNRFSVLCNESGDYVVYESDERGFHNPKGLWNGQRVDIVALGDSYAHGYCVPSDNNFVGLIRNHYPATLNLGMAGHGPLLMLGTIREYVERLRPRVVLWFYYEGNDLKNLKLERDSPLLMRYLEGNIRQGLFDRQADIDRVLKTYVEAVRDGDTMSVGRELFAVFRDPRQLLERRGHIVSLSQLRRQLGLVSGTVVRRNTPQPEVELDLFGKSLQQAKESVSGWGGALYFVYLPHWHRYGRPGSAEGSRERVLQTVRALGLQVIDIHEVFNAQRDPLALFPFRLHGHYNETGHRLVAETVLRSIRIR